ncbi:hypothetical protein MHYP_G00071540 [Metynnis hypsauchen]
MRVILLLQFYFMVLDAQVIVPLPQPQNVTVVSNNFDTVLHWSPGVGTPPGTIYSVSVSVGSTTKKQKKCNNTTINVSKYMKNIERQYILRLQASHGNRSSPVIDRYFTPYTMTYLGPPSVTLAGCGNCFNINISLPDRVSSDESLRFYKGIRFDIHWKKAGDEKVYMLGNMDSLSQQHSKKLSTYTYALLNLEQGGEYCVRAKPHHNVNKNTQVSDWICDFTSAVQKRGAFVTSVAGWTAGFVLVGLGLLIFTASLAYAGFLCKLKRSLPKTLMNFVSSNYLSPEEISISVAKWHGKSNKPKHLEEDVEENRNCRQNDDHDDDENNDEKENDCIYMYRPTNDSVSLATSSGQSSASTAITLCTESENSGGCSIEAEQTALSGITLCQLQHSEVTNIMQEGLSNLRVEKLNPFMSKEAETSGGQISKSGVTSMNINLFSVTLKSLQLEEDVMDEASNAKEISRPFLPLLPRELEEHALCFSKPQTGMPLIVGLKTHIQSQTDVLSQLKDSSKMQSDQLVKHDRTQMGYRATHTGRMDPENDCLLDEEEEEEEDFSGYMGR